ncbi:hypothetical protein [Conexibacter woesei]|uniref:hypothetical protein n=1 Tax=Conexibacter woesei TaxID=191495 RepID=UPI000426CBB4|nr:hypothetical protein [Conexibacter woesei]
MTDHTNNHTTADGLRRAHEAFRGDWDRRGVTMVFLPSAATETLLAARGWTRGQWRGRTGPWRSPTGERIWETGEAIALALTAEVLTDTTNNPPRSTER